MAKQYRRYATLPKLHADANKLNAWRGHELRLPALCPDEIDMAPKSPLISRPHVLLHIHSYRDHCLGHPLLGLILSTPMIPRFRALEVVTGGYSRSRSLEGYSIVYLLESLGLLQKVWILQINRAAMWVPVVRQLRAYVFTPSPLVLQCVDSMAFHSPLWLMISCAQLAGIWISVGTSSSSSRHISRPATLRRRFCRMTRLGLRVQRYS